MFYSVLFPTEEQYRLPRQTEQPDCFKDLNLEQIFEPILKRKKEFELEGFFYTPQRDAAVIVYRQDVAREFENDEYRELFTDFSRIVNSIGKETDSIRTMLSAEEKWYNNYLTRGKMLDNAEKYCQAVSALLENLSGYTFQSAGLRGFVEYISQYCSSERYTGLCADIKRLRDEFSKVEYCMLIKNGTIRLRKYEGQADRSKQILETFEKFRQGDVKDYRHKLSEEPAAAHVEAAVLNMAAELYPDTFAELNAFCKKYFRFDDETLVGFSREIQFYLSWFEFAAPLIKEGLRFCYPKLCQSLKRLYSLEGFDVALARNTKGNTVTNGFSLNAPERIIIVTGPNQGGKTTFARSFGQLHYLASLGLCVPGREAAIYLFDNILTHFGREENLSTLNGKLQDDLARLHELFKKATSRSIVIVNEIFASTTLSDALFLGKKMMDALAELGAPAVVVTFLDELAVRGPETVSMMSTVKDDDMTARTYKIIRKPPDGLAYAMHIAGKHGMTYEQLCGRLKK